MDAASYACLREGGIPDGGVARTICVGDSIIVDLDAQDRVIGVETLGEGIDWRDGLVKLAMAGRLAVPRSQG